MELRLRDGNRVCIIGGGPAGSMAALHLLAISQEMGLSLEVLVFEPRNFTRPGPIGCNHCAGILSSRLQRGLKSLGLSIPDEVIQAEIIAYALHLGDEILRVERPNPERRILSVFRGAGPRLILSSPTSSLDGFLLSEACARGAQLVPHRVRKVYKDGRPVVLTAREEYIADLIVLATGVNSRAPLDPSFDYQPPHTDVMAQDEIPIPDGWPTQEVSVYFRQPPGLIFGALTPKGEYLNVSLLGKDMTAEATYDFYEAQGIKKVFSRLPESLCGCNPRIAVDRAKQYYGDHWVAVGDAAATRLYKDGIGSAFLTSRTAMQTALHRGISRQDFRLGYAPYCQQIEHDNRYGKMLFRLWAFVLNTPSLMEAWIGVARTETVEESQDIISRILWGMFTGDEAYGQLLRLSISPPAISKLWQWVRRSR